MGTDYLVDQFDSTRLVCFRLDESTYATDIHLIQEIIPIPEIRKVPKLPAFMEGIINLRGTMIPVIDLRKVFHLPVNTEEHNKIIVYQTKGRVIAFIVDQVDQVLEVHKSKFLPPPPVILKDVPEGCLKGIIQETDENILLIDLNLVLQEQDFQHVVQAAQSI